MMKLRGMSTPLKTREPKQREREEKRKTGERSI